MFDTLWGVDRAIVKSFRKLLSEIMNAARFAASVSIITVFARFVSFQKGGLYLCFNPANPRPLQRMVIPATTATAVVWLNTEPIYAKEAKSASENVDLKKVRESLIDLIENDEAKRGDGTSLKGTLIRLAWHSSGTYQASDNSGGSNGARMRFENEASYANNAGLDVARKVLEPVKAKFPDLTYSDLYTYAAVVAIEESGGPTIPFRLGREDFDEETALKNSDPYDRLPDADKGSLKHTTEHVRKVFGRMGFSDKEIVALLGAHAMGRCHTDRSGYWGPW